MIFAGDPHPAPAPCRALHRFVGLVAAELHGAGPDRARRAATTSFDWRPFVTAAAAAGESNQMFRQGDVLIVAIGQIPNGAVEVPRKSLGCVLADGKATGHSHAIGSPAAKLYEHDGVRYLRVDPPSAAELTHEEHGTVPIPPGSYRVTIHAEYQPGELPRQVED